MYWILIYLICAMATAVIFKIAVDAEDKKFFKRNGIEGICSLLVMSIAFPVAWVAVIARSVKSYRKRREDIKELWRAHKQLKAMKRELEKEMEIRSEARKAEQERVDKLLENLDKRAAERKADMDRIMSRYEN